MRRPILYDAVFFVALLSAALAMGGALAHLLELPNKIGLAREEYFIVQKAYRGWNLLAFLLLVELASMVALAVLSRHAPLVRRFAIGAIASLLGAQGVFWLWTFPANMATRNWTFIPPDWAALRDQWEYSHAAGALFQILAVSLLVVASLHRARRAEKAAG